MRAGEEGRKMKRLLIAAALTTALAVPSAAGADTSQGTLVVVPRGQPVQIAFATDLSGPASGFGTSLANAVQMAVDAHPAIRGFPIKINTVDAPCGDPTADVAAATSIVANGQNVGVLGQLCSSGFDQALPIYQSADVVTITGSATAPGLSSFGPTVFNRTAVNDTCCPFVDGFDPWYATVVTLPSDIAWQLAYNLKFGTAPTAFADLYYDAARLLIRNLQNVSSVDSSGNLVVDRATLAQAVRSTTKYQGVSCTITLDPATGDRLDDTTSLSPCATDTD
jgi:ABC-type branched-subunit amino acid transport system substrate-binding protein